MRSLTNNSVPNDVISHDLSDVFRLGDFTGKGGLDRGKKRKLNPHTTDSDGGANSNKKIRQEFKKPSQKKNPHHIVLDHFKLNRNQSCDGGDMWDFKNMDGQTKEPLGYYCNNSVRFGDKSMSYPNKDTCKKNQDDEGDDDDVNFNQTGDGDSHPGCDNEGDKSEGSEATNITEPKEDPPPSIDGKTITEMSWMPHDKPKSITNKSVLTEYEINREKLSKLEARGSDSGSEGDGEGEDSDDENSVSFEGSLPEDIEAKDMDIDNFGNLGQFKLLDGQSLLDDIKRALINCNHGMDEYKYCKMIADKFNDSVAKPYNERREQKLKAMNSRIGGQLDINNVSRQKGQQRIDSYFVKGPASYWTTEKVYNYRKVNVCPISVYLDMAMGFRDIHNSLRESVVYEHRSEVYPNGRPVVKAEEKIWKVVKESADMYFKFMNAKPQDSIYANPTRKVLTGINDIVDANSLQKRPSAGGPGNKSNFTKNSSASSRRGGSTEGKSIAYDHPALKRVKDRKSVGAIPKVGGYAVNNQVNQYDF